MVNKINLSRLFLSKIKFIFLILILSILVALSTQNHKISFDNKIKAPPTPSKPPITSSDVLASYSTPFLNGLITNEYAYYNQQDSTSKLSQNWQMTSGSLFARNGYYWTGNSDSCDAPNANSTNCNNSEVFRLNSTRQFAGNINVSLSLIQNKDIHNTNCNDDDSCWHGTHIWLRYLSQYNLYYVSVNRADGQVVIKRKVPCGDDNSGTYFVLGDYLKHDFKSSTWNSYSTTIQTNSDGSVTIKLFDNSISKVNPIDTATDRGGTNPNWSTSCKVSGKYSSTLYPPITQTGSIGLRGDYSNFEFTNLVVSKF